MTHPITARKLASLAVAHIEANEAAKAASRDLHRALNTLSFGPASDALIERRRVAYLAACAESGRAQHRACSVICHTEPSSLESAMAVVRDRLPR